MREGLRLIAEGILERLEGIEFAAVGGMSIGADPIVGGVLTVAAERRRPARGLPGAEADQRARHQAGRRRAGRTGLTVVIVEDVITTGGMLDAIDRVKELGCRVACVVGVCDRLQGGAAAFAARDVPFHSLFTIRDLGITA